MADPRAELERLRQREELKALREQFPDVADSDAKPVSKLTSAAQGAAQGATFGFADEALAGAKTLFDKIKEGGGTFSGPSSWEDLYSKRVAKEREDVARAKEANPLSFTTGNLAGAGLTNLIPGVGIARGAGLGTTLGKAALQGGLVGAGESVPKDQGELLEDIGKGAALGAGAQGVFGGLAGLAGKLKPSALNKFAEERAVKAAVGPNRAALREALGIPKNAKSEQVTSQISKVGRDLLDEGIISSLAKTEDIAPLLEESAKKYGKEIGDIGKLIDEKMPGSFNPLEIRDKILEYASTLPPGGKALPVQKKLLEEAAHYEQMANTAKQFNQPALGFKNIHDLKQQYPYIPQAADALFSDKDATNKLRSIFGDTMEDVAKRAEDTGGADVKDLLKRYQEAKSKYGSFIGTAKASGREQANDLVRRVVSPSDYATGIGTGAATAIATGQPAAAATGILAAAANKFSRERGSSTAAIIADTLAKKLESSPQLAQDFGQILMEAAQRGPAAMTATHLMLMKNPRYSEQFQGQLPSGTPGAGEPQRGVK